MINRRSLITGLISLVAAPAIVRAGSLMPVKVMPTEAQLLDFAERLVNPPLIGAHGLTVGDMIAMKRAFRAQWDECAPYVLVQNWVVK